MPWSRTADLFINLSAANSQLRTVRSSTDRTATLPQWVSSDCFLLRVWFLEETGNVGSPLTSVALADGDVLVLAGKKAVTSANLLFSAIDFEKVTDDDGTRYEAIVDLHTEAMLAAFSATESVFTATADLEVENPDNSERRTLQFQLSIRKQAYAGEADPIPAEPIYPSPAALALKAPENGSYRIVTDGAEGWLFQLKAADTGLFHTLFINGGALAIGAGEA